LIDLFGNRGQRQAQIIMTFDAPFSWGDLRTDIETLRFRIANASSDLKAYRQYSSFNSWLRIEPAGADLEIVIAKPVEFEEPLFETLENPYRLKIQFPQW